MRKLDRRFALQVWVPALRSGKYEQTKGFLPDDHGYCCLGVACDVLGMNWDSEYCDTPLRHYTSLPADVVNTYGFGSSTTINVLTKNLHKVPALEKSKFSDKVDSGGVYDYTKDDYTVISLATLNDSGLTFDEIADIIEQVVATYEEE